MKNYLLLKFGLMLISSILFYSCNKSFDDLNNIEDIPKAGFTMINLNSEEEYIIHKVDNNAIQHTNNPLRYKHINFAYLYPGHRRIQTINNINEVLIDSTYTIKEGLFYTSIIYTKSNNSIGQLITEDNLINSNSNNAALRIFNLSHDEVTVDVLIDGLLFVDMKVYNGIVNISNATNFKKISAGTKMITIKNQQNEILIEKEISFKNNIHYSLFVVKNKLNNKYELVLYEQYKL